MEVGYLLSDTSIFSWNENVGRNGMLSFERMGQCCVETEAHLWTKKGPFIHW